MGGEGAGGYEWMPFSAGMYAHFYFSIEQLAIFKDLDEQLAN